MADEADIETTLVTLIAAALYPDGTGAASAPGPDCRVYRGWPNAVALDADLARGVINVTVFAGTGAGRTTTRFPDTWQATPPPVTLTAAVSGNSVTFAGTAAAGQLAGILVDGRSYVYRVQAGDTPGAVAASLAGLARDQAIVQLTGTRLVINGAGDLLARVVADAAASQEIRRQVQNYRITCWCPDPVSRDRSIAAIDIALAPLRFLDLPDGSQGRLIYAGTSIFDQSEEALLYRRDLLYTVEYPTMLVTMQPAMLFGSLGLDAESLTV